MMAEGARSGYGRVATEEGELEIGEVNQVEINEYSPSHLNQFKQSKRSESLDINTWSVAESHPHGARIHKRSYYVIFLLEGIVVLWPFNALTVAGDYFRYIFAGTSFEGSIMSYIVTSYNIVNLVCLLFLMSFPIQKVSNCYANQF